MYVCLCCDISSGTYGVLVVTSAILKSKQPIKGFQDQTERLQVAQAELATSKKELAEAYEKSAKHARSLFDYIERTKEIETKLHQSNL